MIIQRSFHQPSIGAYDGDILIIINLALLKIGYCPQNTVSATFSRQIIGRDVKMDTLYAPKRVL